MADATDTTYRAHSFFVGQTWLRIRNTLKPALALTISVAIGQSSSVASIEGSSRYLSPIFTHIFMANKPRVQHLQLGLLTAFLGCAIIPFTMLAYLCARATRDPIENAKQFMAYAEGLARGDATGPAIFYQGRPAAIAAVFLFILAWAANVLKTLFFPFIFCFVSAAIIGTVLLLEAIQFPEWTQFYSVVEAVLYNAFIGIAIAMAVNLIIFPYNAREQMLQQTASFLDAAEAAITQHSKHFSSFHLRAKENAAQATISAATSDEAGSDRLQGDKPTYISSTSNESGSRAQSTADDDVSKLQDTRDSVIRLAAGLQNANAMSDQEIAYGSLDASTMKILHTFCTELVGPVLGCNLWAQVSSSLRDDFKAKSSERHREFHGILASLNVVGDPSESERAALFVTMEEQIAPRFSALSLYCKQAIEHIKRALRLGIFQSLPFYLRPFVVSPRAYNEEDAHFSDIFEAEIQNFWSQKHAASVTSYNNQETSSAATMLILYMESILHSTSLKLLKFCRWTDELQAAQVLQKNRLVAPSIQRFTSDIRRKFQVLLHHSDAESQLEKDRTNLRGLDEATLLTDENYIVAAPEAFLSASNPQMTPRNTVLSKVMMFLYRLKTFIFDSDVGAFGIRAGVAMTVGALPAFFPDSYSVFLRYRLLWVSLTVLLGLQPILGKGIAALLMRTVGTIAGGVLGLLVVEIGRVPAGIIPVFFVSVLPFYYVVQLSPLFLLPVLFTIITEVLIVGYKLTADTLGKTALEASGQVYLETPVLMGYRILLTLAGLVITFVFSIIPALPTARGYMRQDFAKHLYTTAEVYQLCSLRTTEEKYELPAGLDDALKQKQMQALRLSAVTTEYTGLTKFEFSPRGVFPISQWKRLLLLLDNLDAALAVSNHLFTVIRAKDPERKLKFNTLLLHPTSERFSRLVTATLYALGSSINRWEPIPPIFDSAVESHIAKQRMLAAAADSIGFDNLDLDVVTHFSAYMVSTAILARCLENLVHETEVLVGASRLKMYLVDHKRNTKAE